MTFIHEYDILEPSIVDLLIQIQNVTHIFITSYTFLIDLFPSREIVLNLKFKSSNQTCISQLFWDISFPDIFGIFPIFYVLMENSIWIGAYWLMSIFHSSSSKNLQINSFLEHFQSLANKFPIIFTLVFHEDSIELNCEVRYSLYGAFHFIRPTVRWRHYTPSPNLSKLIVTLQNAMLQENKSSSSICVNSFVCKIQVWREEKELLGKNGIGPS